MDYLYYPEVNDTGNAFITIVRKEKDGVWYDWVIKESYLEEYKQVHLQRLHRNAYYTIVLGEVSPDLKAAQGYNMFSKCENQQLEKERLTKLITLIK